jgi:hypothetical protein
MLGSFFLIHACNNMQTQDYQHNSDNIKNSVDTDGVEFEHFFSTDHRKVKQTCDLIVREILLNMKCLTFPRNGHQLNAYQMGGIANSLLWVGYRC